MGDFAKLNVKGEVVPLSRDDEGKLLGGFAVLQGTDDSNSATTNARHCTNGRCDSTRNGRNCKNEISCAGATNDRRCENSYETAYVH